MNDRLQVIMPMCGDGSRFADKGYDMLKPLIEIDGRPMYQWALDSLREYRMDYDITFVIRKDHDEQFSLGEILKKAYPYSAIVKVSGKPNGPAMSVLAGLGAPRMKSRKDCQVLVMDCDVACYGHLFHVHMDQEMYSEPCTRAMLMTFRSDDGRYSCVDTYRSRVMDIQEKNPVYRDAVAGNYWFRELSELRRAIRGAHDDLKDAGREIYMSDVVKKYISMGMPVMAYPADTYESFGTPEELETARHDRWMHATSNSGQYMIFHKDTVEKSAYSENVQRLSQQAKKQMYFHYGVKGKDGLFDAPRILAEDWGPGRLRVTMERVPGKRFDEWLMDAGKMAWTRFEKALADYLEHNRKPGMEDFSQEARGKLYGMMDKTEDRELYNMIKNMVKCIDSHPLMLPPGECHGDMTLGNMVFDKRKVWLLDFLPSYIDSPVMDIVKLRQDTNHLWSFLKAGVECIGTARHRMVCLDHMLEKILRQWGVDSATYQILDAINIMRLMPYIAYDSGLYLWCICVLRVKMRKLEELGMI